MNIGDFQERVESTLELVAGGRGVPSNLRDLRFLVPSGSRPELSVRNVSTGRKVRDDASFDYFDPSQCEVVIRYIAVEEDEDGEPGAPPSTGNSMIPNQIDELLKALEEAERSRDFVGLTWFRDQFLVNMGGAWADDLALRRRLIDAALNEKLVLTNQVANPRNHLHPVTAIRLNRRHPRFVKNQERPAAQKRFQPARISGGALSKTVIEGRR